jgi:predicted metal-dependent hydrolase
MMREDGKLFDIKAHLKDFWYMFSPRSGFVSRSLLEILRYIKPSFHPRQKDNSCLIENWVEGHREYLVTPSA